METLWISFPKIGGFSLKASHLCRPLSVAIHLRSITTPTMIDGDEHEHQPRAQKSVGRVDHQLGGQRQLRVQRA